MKVNKMLNFVSCFSSTKKLCLYSPISPYCLMFSIRIPTSHHYTLSLETFSLFSTKQNKMGQHLCLLHCYLISFPSVADGSKSPITHNTDID